MAEPLFLRVAFRGRPERLFEAAQATGARMMRLRTADDNLRFDVTPEDLSALRHALRGKGRLRPIGHGGWALAAREIRRNPWRLVLPIVGVIAYLVLASFIWTVQVLGPKDVPTRAILRAAAEFGLRSGSSRFLVHPAQVAREIEQAVPGLIFCAVRIDGGRAYIWAAPALPPPKAPPGVSPGTLVAATDGYVTRVVTVRGVPVVKRGETVQRGEPLILPRGRGAMGAVYARVWRLQVYRYPVAGGTYVETGHSTARWFVSLGGGRVYAPLGLKPPYRRFVRALHEWRIQGTPVEVGTVTYLEQRHLPVRYSEAYARLRARTAAEATVLRQMDGAKVLSVREVLARERGTLLVDVWVEVEVNIARTSAGERADY